MYKFSTFIFLLLIFSKNTVNSQSKELVSSINLNAIEIEDSNLELPFTNNQALDSIFQNVKIFGFGEATHGTKEFFELKHKFFRYLVLNHNLKIFSIEANFSNCLAIDSYIKNGKGNPKVLLSKINYWIWNTNEMLSLIEWMRTYNSTKVPEQQISFYGLDVMDCQNAAILLNEYLQNNHLADSAKYLDVINNYISDKNSNVLSKQVLKDHFLILKKLETNLDNSYLWDLNNSILQYISMKLDFSQSLRDKLMFDNVDRLTGRAGKDNKVFVWSHNFHVNKNKIPFTNDFSMGYYLKNKYLKEYYSIGFDFGSGEFNAFNIKTKNIQMYSIDEPIRKSSSEIFNQSSSDIFFLDLGKSNYSPGLKKFLNSNLFYQAIGANYNPKMIEKGKLADAFDGIIFVKKTNRSSLILK